MVTSHLVVHLLMSSYSPKTPGIEVDPRQKTRPSSRQQNDASPTRRVRNKIGASNAAQRHRRLMLNKIANRLYDKANQKFPTLRSVFAHLDEDGKGVVDRKQFKEGLRKSGFRIADVDSDLIFDTVGSDDNNITYDEFVDIFNPVENRFSHKQLGVHEHVREIDTSFHVSSERHLLPPVSPVKAEYLRDRLQQKIVNREKDAKVTPTLLKAFKTFDPRQDGFISYDEFRHAMGPVPPGLNLGLSDQETKELISLVDPEKEGIIKLQQFVTSLAKSSTSEDFVEKIRSMEMDGLVQRMAADLPNDLKSASKKWHENQANKQKEAHANEQTPRPADVAQRVIDMLRVRCAAAGKVRKVFRTYDEDKSGKISRFELRHVMKNLGIPLNTKESDALFDFFDVNNDGGIFYDEFAEVIFAPSRSLNNNNTLSTIAMQTGVQKPESSVLVRSIAPKRTPKEKKSMGQFIETRYDTAAGKACHESKSSRAMERSQTSVRQFMASSRRPGTSPSMVPSIFETARSANTGWSKPRPKTSSRGGSRDAMFKRSADAIGASYSPQHLQNSTKLFQTIDNKHTHIASRREMSTLYALPTNSLTQASSQSGMFMSEKRRMRTSSSNPNVLTQDLARKSTLRKKRAIERATKGHATITRYALNHSLTQDMVRVADEDRLKEISQSKWNYGQSVNNMEYRAKGRKPGYRFVWDDHGNILSKEGVQKFRPSGI